MYRRNTTHTLDSLLARTKRVGDCILWQGATKANGYGVVAYKGYNYYAHRLFYSLLVGEIPPNTEIDHQCNSRNCVNVEHLKAVTHAENMRLSIQRRRTCKKGHEWNDANTYVCKVKRKQGGFRMQRYCRICRADAQRVFRNNKGGLVK